MACPKRDFIKEESKSDHGGEKNPFTSLSNRVWEELAFPPTFTFHTRFLSVEFNPAAGRKQPKAPEWLKTFCWSSSWQLLETICGLRFACVLLSPGHIYGDKSNTGLSRVCLRGHFLNIPDTLPLWSSEPQPTCPGPAPPTSHSQWTSFVLVKGQKTKLPSFF